MAAKKAKSAKKHAKKSTGKSSAKKPAAAAKRRATSASRAPMTTKDKSRLVKPGGEFADHTERFIETWMKNRRALKVPGVTPSKIKTRLSRAQRAIAREDHVRTKMQARLQPLTDQRMQAEHDTWKLVLDVYAVAKAQARFHPELTKAFGFMSEVRAARAKPKAAQGGGDAGTANAKSGDGGASGTTK